MAKITGFMEFEQHYPSARPVQERIQDSKEFVRMYSVSELNQQSARCMDCGVPFCQSGCPLGNIIPEFNDAVYRGNFGKAYQILARTNNFPEFTGRVCPAPCESACVLGINQQPIVIEAIEKHIIEHAFANGLVQAKLPLKRSSKKVAVIGSGPAGLAAASELNQLGHTVAVYEKNGKPGGLLRYGIPDFKLEKHIIDRRVDLLKIEGVVFKCNQEVGVDISAENLLRDYDAVVLANGCEDPREYNIPGTNLPQVNLAMPFLVEHNKRVALANAGYVAEDEQSLSARGKRVVVIGGGDTASDCIGTANRQQAASITQLIRAPRPPRERTSETPWPTVAHLDELTTSQEEGSIQIYEVAVKEFIHDGNGKLTGVKIVNLQCDLSKKKVHYSEVAGSERVIPCDLALIAIGFANPIYENLLEALDLELTAAGNVAANENDYQTSIPHVFAAGDVRRGQSLVVWAIREGRECAKSVDQYLAKVG